MRKALLLIGLLAVSAIAIYAQSPKIEMSAPFHESKIGWKKIIQTTNGHTLFIRSKQNNIQVTVFDKTRKIIAEESLNSKILQSSLIEQSDLNGVYQINNEVVVFLAQTIHKQATLFRLLIDINTGKLNDEKAISHIEKYRIGKKWAMTWGGMDPNRFYVEKDPHSGHYAVVNLDNFAHDSGKRLKFSLYGENHKELCNAFYGNPAKLKYNKFVAMAINGDQAFLCTYSFNSASKFPENSKLVLSKITSTETQFYHNAINLEDLKATIGVMQYDDHNKMLRLTSMLQMGGKNSVMNVEPGGYYLPTLSYIDPQSLTVTFTKPITCEKVSRNITSRYRNDSLFTGVPVDMIINEDHTITLLTEEIAQFTHNNSYSGAVESTETMTGDIGISQLNNTGTELSGYGIVNFQRCKGSISPFYRSEKNKGICIHQKKPALDPLNDYQFFCFDYAAKGKNNYIIVNQFPESYESLDKKERKQLGIDASETFCYEISDTGIRQYYLLGGPKDRDHSIYCYILPSDYDRKTNTYATLAIERDNMNKQSRIIWATFE